MSLSICIATIPERHAEFIRLVASLGDGAEIIRDARPRAEISIGLKRQAMIEKATGEYVVHIDDDDLVPADYIAMILQALESKPDCVGHYELVEGMAAVPQLSKWTKDAPGWMHGQQARRYGVDYVRTTFHKTPLKRAHALAVGFADMRFAEDHDFSKRLAEAGLCKREVFIPRVMYTYRFTQEDHGVKYGIK